MSILATEQLSNNVPVTQTIYFSNNKVVDGVRVHLLKTGTLVNGTLTLNLKVNGVTETTVTRTYTEINMLGTHWHGMLSLEFDAPLVIRKSPTLETNELTLEFILSGHTDSGSIFIALVHSSDVVTDLVHDEGADYFPTYGDDAGIDVWNNPYEIELYTLN